jgi:ribosome maturation factor RimP
MHGSSRQGSARPASRGSAPAAAGPRDSAAAGPKDSTAARPRGSAPAAAGPADAEQLTRLLRPVVTAAGMDLENIRITATGRRRLLRVTVDADHGVSLDDITLISRTLSAELDAIGAMGETPYTLEVSSPGADRPLTEPRHWRRARGRLVRVKVAGEGSVEGRLLAADADGVTLGTVVNGRASGERRFPYADMGAGSVQVEFGRISDAELDDFTVVPRGDDTQDLPQEDDNPYLPGRPELDDTVFDNDTDLGAGGDGH